MLENLVIGTVFQKSLFVMIFGITGVFLVLVLFYFLLRILQMVFPYKFEEK